jgi:hypothetical protein
MNFLGFGKKKGYDSVGESAEKDAENPNPVEGTIETAKMMAGGAAMVLKRYIPPETYENM